MKSSNPLNDPPWKRVSGVVSSVKDDMAHVEDRGYECLPDRSERIDALAGDLRVAALSARMAMAATRMMQSETTGGRSSMRGALRSGSGLSEKSEVPDHVRRVSQYLEGLPSDVVHASSYVDRSDWDVTVRRSSVRPTELMNSGETLAEEYSFVEQPACQAGVMVAIILNMLALTLETDHPRWPFWDLINGIFIMFYIGELALHVQLRGLKGLFWTSKEWLWMVYSAFVVTIGIVDFLAACLFRRDLLELTDYRSREGEPLVTPQRLEDIGAASWELPLVRFLMLTRILRLYRIVRMHKPLYDFARLLGGMLGTFVWILSIILLFCLVLAVVLTRLLGHTQPVDESSETVHQRFRDIPTTLFTLFQLTTMDDWSTIATPMVDLSTAWRLFFIAFITFMSWTMLSLLTAIASECFIAESKVQKHEERLVAEVARQDFTRFICTEFIHADSDRNGLLDKEEFIALMSRDMMVEEMQQQGLDLKTRDLGQTWDNFDVDDNGQLTIDELVDGFSFLMEDLATKHIAGVEHALKRFSRKMEVASDGLQSMLENAVQLTSGAVVASERRQERRSKLEDRLARVRQAVEDIVKAEQAPPAGSATNLRTVRDSTRDRASRTGRALIPGLQAARSRSGLSEGERRSVASSAGRFLT